MTSGKADMIDGAVDARRDPYLDTGSLEFRFRAKRFAKIRPLIEAALAERGEAEILDLGGTEKYWLSGGDFIRDNRSRLHITLVNLETEPVRDAALFSSIPGDATDAALLDGQTFDLVHSNSVVEHVGAFDDMRRFAENTRRLGRRYYVQTPNYWFPFEPHFRFAGFQYLPEALRARLIQRHAFGFFSRVESAEEARAIIDHHRLVSTRQMRRLFPDAALSHETVFGLRKSIVAIRT